MFDLILPVLAMLVPVLAVVGLALAFGRRLSGSCGGVGRDGTCRRCGKTAEDIEQLQVEGGSNRSCP